MRAPDCLVDIEAKVRAVLPAVRNPVRVRNFLLSKIIQTRSRAHTVPCSMGIWAPSSRVKRPDVISGFRREVAENFVLLGYYAASSVNFLPMFQDNLWSHHHGSRIQKKRNHSKTLKMGPIICPEKSVRNYHYSLRKNP